MPENSYILTQVMQRYAIDPLKADGYFFYSNPPLPEVNKEFLFSLISSFEEKTFSAAEFDPFSIEMIVDYIQRTHSFYLQKKLPEIEQSIILLSSLYKSNHPILSALRNFFQRYCKELTVHINEEEEKLLPYIVLLRNARGTTKDFSAYILARQQFSIAEFLKGHHDTEDELLDIRNTIQLYRPPATNQSLYRILLSQLHAFEQDLHVHAHMEEEVLIPKALKIETELNNKLLQTTPSN